MNSIEKRPQFSIVIAVHDQGDEIARNLPALLTYQYEEGFEVIIVDESSTDNTADVLKQLKAEHNNLYTTFLPKYQFQKNRRRLALTIGVKAAKYEWTVFADISTPPSTDQWLAEIAALTDDSTALILGYISKRGTMRLQTFDSIEKAKRIVSKTERKKANDGHGGRWLRYLRGEYDYMVVRTAQGHDVLRLFEQAKIYKL